MNSSFHPAADALIFLLPAAMRVWASPVFSSSPVLAPRPIINLFHRASIPPLEVIKFPHK